MSNLESSGKNQERDRRERIPQACLPKVDLHGDSKHGDCDKDMQIGVRVQVGFLIHSLSSHTYGQII